jgi:ATP-dependent phosphofructokinase / diphosphate-dependent phosphofructokinase
VDEAIKKIAVHTGGRDAPGPNSVIRDCGLIELHRSTVRQISHLGGAILGTTNRGKPFRRVVEQPGAAKLKWTAPTT